jgi:hypothetical protein
MERNNTQKNKNTQNTSNKKQNMQSKKTSGLNGNNITIIFNVGSRWRRWVSPTSQPSYAREECNLVSVEQGAGWVPKMVWTL